MSKQRAKNNESVIFDRVNTCLLIIVLLIVLYPLIYIVSSSFSSPSSIIKGEVWLFPKDFTLESYRKVFQDDDILIGYKNTILYTLIGTVINLVMNILTAYPLSRKDFKGRNAIMFILVFTMFFNALIYLKDKERYPLQLILRNILIQNEISQEMQGETSTMADQALYAESIKYAVIIVSTLPVLMLYPFIQKYFVKGVMVGAVKG